MISSLRKFHFYRVVAVAALLLAGPIAPALSQSPKDWKCTGNPDIPPDQQITGCTNAIQSGKYSGKNLSWAYGNRGIAYRAKGNLDSAIADFNEAIRLDPKFAVTYINRGLVYFSKGDYGRAIADCSEAIKRDGKNAFAYQTRGIIYRYGNSLAQAQADLKQAADLSPKNAYAALWVDIAERHSNLPSHLAEAAKHLNMDAWPAPVVRLFLGEATPAAVLSAADHADPIKKKGQVCEANFFVAEHALLQNKKDEALRLYKLAASECSPTFLEARAAKAALARIAK